ncbi:MAG TPA: hypothetical protein VGW34_03380 [Allosphingosinicella sp.]|nr:hypothetical protein [Allosphingosinicella sp.]
MDFEDTFYFAGCSEGKRGLAEVNLAGYDKPSEEGDLIDATATREVV